MKRQWLFLLFLGGLAVMITGCSDSNSSDMDHSGMDHSSMSDSVNNGENEGTSKMVTKTEKITDKEFTIVAQTSHAEIAPGVMLPVWTYNNSVPGPEIRVTEGDKVKITLENELPDPVTIHWHGIPVPNAMDGIPGVTQNAVQPGDSFVYEFDADVPGTYWYHSHQDGVNQVDKGLYGTIIIEEEDQKVDKDYTLVLDEWMSSGNMDMDMSSDTDMSSMDHSQMEMSSEEQHAANAPAAGHDMSMYDLYTMNGKSGSLADKLVVKEGDKVRIRLVNAGFKSHTLHLHGHDFQVTATDGQPIQSPAFISDQGITIAPGERYDLEFVADNPGNWLLEEHGSDSAVSGMRTIIEYEGVKAGNDTPNPSASLPTIDITTYGQKNSEQFTLTQEYDLEYTMNLGTEDKDGGQIFTINGKAYPDTDKINVQKGDLIRVTLKNVSKVDDHPMHLHGHFFQVLSKNGQALQGSNIMKDTLNLKPGDEYVVAFEADNPGDWMFHCHDLHHASAGMVTHLLYTDFKSDFNPDPNADNKPE